MLRYSVQLRYLHNAMDICLLLEMWEKSKNDNNKNNNISENVSSKYSQKLLDHDKQSAADALKTASIRATQKTLEVTGDLIGNRIADKIKSA